LSLPYKPSGGPQYHPFVIYPCKEKIELSKYNGNENQCVSWFNKAEEHFNIYNITTHEEKVKYDFLHLEGESYNWYMWWKK